MTTVRLTVNGESCSADVADRTQLAELLRDHLHLTGTHLGCEHGVCGACTVLVDGKPIRSCITYAHACEGATVVTVEGLGDDPTGRALREAFTRHHALQCGFCTPGMLITAWDIVTRLAPQNEAAIRHELSGNLCRCTGYMGIVAAVRDVARQRRGGTSADAGTHTDTDVMADAGATERRARTAEDVGTRGGVGDTSSLRQPGARSRPALANEDEPPSIPGIPQNRKRGLSQTRDLAIGRPPGGVPSAPFSTHPPPPATPSGNGKVSAPDRGHAAKHDASCTSAVPAAGAFEPFEVDPIHLADAEPATATDAPGAAGRPMTQADGWTLVEREFVIGHPADALWSLFEDLPRVAECLPGVHVESAELDRFSGRAEIRFGPVGATFHGEGTRRTDAEGRTGVISGRGSDTRGHATLDAELRYAMSGEETHGPELRTRVGVGIRFRLQGGLAQFNRGDLVESFADVMLAEFVRNCDRRLAGEEIRSGAGTGGFTLLWRMIRVRLGL